MQHCHPTDHFNGFCPSCPRQRLIILDPSSSPSIKSLFFSNPKPSNPTSFVPELRRSKSFSASMNEALGVNFEPLRKSCDVRARNTLSTLFSLHEESIASSSANQNHQNSKKIESLEDIRGPQNIDDIIGFVDDDGDEIRPVQDSHLEGLRKSDELDLTNGETENNMKPMKDHIDFTSHEKSSGGGFWSAASAFSKKWQKWRTKQKAKKQDGEHPPTLSVKKPISGPYRETQSEIADYGFVRRSCDTDPSLDDARCSFEEPRASWDGYLIRRSFSRMAPMVSVIEDVSRSDMQIPVEDEDEGSAQTKDYSLDSSFSWRKSLDRSSSIKCDADSFHGAKHLVDSNPSSMRDDLSETFELSGIRDINLEIGKETKKPRRWRWRIWRLILRRNGGNRNENDDDDNGRLNRTMLRSNSSVSWRNDNYIGSSRKSFVEMYGNGKKRNEFVLDKNRSARYSESPNYFDNGLLRFYLKPVRGSRRGRGPRKIKPTNSQPVARSVMRFY